MATLVTPTNLQKMEFDVTTAEGPSRVTIVTGTVSLTVGINSTGPYATDQRSYKVLLDPILTPGQFRKAISTVSLSNIVHVDGPPPTLTRWTVEDAQATFDDESGKVQLVIEARVLVGGDSANAHLDGVTFQVTTLSSARHQPPSSKRGLRKSHE